MAITEELLMRKIRAFQAMTGETLPAVRVSKNSIHILPGFKVRARKGLRARIGEYVRLNGYITQARLNGIEVRGWP